MQYQLMGFEAASAGSGVDWTCVEGPGSGAGCRPRQQIKSKRKQPRSNDRSRIILGLFGTRGVTVEY